jgi:hypothetical protein
MAMTSLMRYATSAHASFPSTVTHSALGIRSLRLTKAATGVLTAFSLEITGFRRIGAGNPAATGEYPTGMAEFFVAPPLRNSAATPGQEDVMRLRAIVTAAVLVVAAAARASAQEPTPTPTFVWADACKTCHAAQYDAWAKSKHAHALARLSTTERGGDCIRCHVTGAPALAGDLSNANVQCEACHGAGRAHMDAATGGAAKPAAIVRKPAESACVGCHSDKSPHFKFFSYPALAPLVHPVNK